MLHDDGLRRDRSSRDHRRKLWLQWRRESAIGVQSNFGGSAARLSETLRLHSIVIDSVFVPYHFATFPVWSRRGLPVKRHQRNSPSKPEFVASRLDES